MDHLKVLLNQRGAFERSPHYQYGPIPYNIFLCKLLQI